VVSGLSSKGCSGKPPPATVSGAARNAFRQISTQCKRQTPDGKIPIGKKPVKALEKWANSLKKIAFGPGICTIIID